MRNVLTAAAALLAITAVASPEAIAASNKYQDQKCFTGGGGTCVQQGGGVFTLGVTVQYVDYAGVYVPGKSLAGISASSLALSFSYQGDTAGGAPRFSIPLDTDGKSNTVEGYLFVDTACDANHDNVVDLTEPGCIVSDSWGYYGTYANYFNSYQVANAQSFIINDWVASSTVSNIVLKQK
jgi:hypothetical protein